MSYGQLAAGQRLTEHELRREMVRVGRLLWERGFVAATDGNLSVRLGSDRLLVTPSGVSKGFYAAEDLLVLGLDGRPVVRYGNRGRRASSEIAMHLEVYRQRSDVQAVVHAHPPHAVAFSIAGVSLARCVIPEVIVTLGSIPTTDYATPGTDEVPGSIRQAIQEYDAIIMTHHGSLTVGKSLWEAYLRLEKVEHTAEITLVAHQLGRVNTLLPPDVDKLVDKRRALLQQEGRDVCEGCSVCILGDEYQVQTEPAGVNLPGAGLTLQDPLAQQITQSVMNKLQET